MSLFNFSPARTRLLISDLRAQASSVSAASVTAEDTTDFHVAVREAAERLNLRATHLGNYLHRVADNSERVLTQVEENDAALARDLELLR
ncbi:hypothetical protein WG915_06850 [Corynebacterium sp. H128]|uniref:hypothetical protein n=1 Tax=Corynebacterium sp. H128 TaxID=3133427 RepID=UPI0030A561A8